MLISLIKRLGCEILDLGVIKDNFEHTQKKLNKNLSSFDLIITSGGFQKAELITLEIFFQYQVKSTSGNYL